jgi:hypothetical protein
MEVILPAFVKRFPGVTIDHIDATADKLLARMVAESREGRHYTHHLQPTAVSKASVRPSFLITSV